MQNQTCDEFTCSSCSQNLARPQENPHIPNWWWTDVVGVRGSVDDSSRKAIQPCFSRHFFGCLYYGGSGASHPGLVPGICHKWQCHEFCDSIGGAVGCSCMFPKNSLGPRLTALTQLTAVPMKCGEKNKNAFCLQLLREKPH